MARETISTFAGFLKAMPPTTENLLTVAEWVDQHDNPAQLYAIAQYLSENIGNNLSSQNILSISAKIEDARTKASYSANLKTLTEDIASIAMNYEQVNLSFQNFLEVYTDAIKLGYRLMADKYLKKLLDRVVFLDLTRLIAETDAIPERSTVILGMLRTIEDPQKKALLIPFLGDAGFIDKKQMGEALNVLFRAMSDPQLKPTVFGTLERFNFSNELGIVRRVINILGQVHQTPEIVRVLGILQKKLDDAYTVRPPNRECVSEPVHITSPVKRRVS